MDRTFEDILRRAGDMMLRARDPRVRAKEGHSNYVTETDVAVQDFLEERLAPLFPGVSFIAEEGEAGSLGDGAALIVDPIDGTTNFFRRRGCSVISVGLVERRRAVMGAIYNPYTGQMFYARRGQGAYADGERLRVSDIPLDSALIAFGTAPYYPEMMAVTARSVGLLLPAVCDLRRSGSAAYDLTELARGVADGMFEWRLQPWDFCAGSLIVEESGGVCGRITGGDIAFVPDEPFMAANPRVFDGLQALLLDAWEREGRPGGA